MRHDSIFGFKFHGYTRKVAILILSRFSLLAQCINHFVQYCGFAHAIDTTKDIDSRIKIPHDVFSAVPETIYFYTLDILCSLCHSSDFL